MITYGGVATFLVAQFGAAYTGLSTVGYTIKNPNGTTFQSRTTTGVIGLGDGSYGVSYVAPSAFSGYIEWDTGGGSPVYAREELLVIATPSITVVSPTSTDGTTLTLVRGDDYKAADSRSLKWTSATGSWPNLTGATITVTFNFPTPLTKTGAVDVASGAGQQVHVDLAAADTAAVIASTYPYDVQATLASGNKITLAEGYARMLLDYTP